MMYYELEKKKYTVLVTDAVLSWLPQRTKDGHHSSPERTQPVRPALPPSSPVWDATRLQISSRQANWECKEEEEVRRKKAC